MNIYFWEALASIRPDTLLIPDLNMLEVLNHDSSVQDIDGYNTFLPIQSLS